MFKRKLIRSLFCKHKNRTLIRSYRMEPVQVDGKPLVPMITELRCNQCGKTLKYVIFLSDDDNNTTE